MSNIEIQINPIIKDLFFNKNTRHNILRGGRSSGKSWGICDCLILDAIKNAGSLYPCLREFQASIKRSSYQQVKENLDIMIEKGIPISYTQKQNSIRLNNNSEFIFMGISNSTGTDRSIKSLYTEKVRMIWIEEAQTLTSESLRLMKNTFRKEGSRIFYTMNPQTPVDAVFDLAKDSAHCSVVTLNWDSNPFFPDVENKERLYDLENSTTEVYKHDWEGEPYQEGATLIPNSYLVSMPYFGKKEDPIYLGVDISTGESADKTAYTIATDFMVIKQGYINESDPRKIAEAINNLSKEYNASLVNVDKGNIGWAIGKELTDYLFMTNVNMVDFGGTSNRSNCVAKREEMYYELMERLKVGMNLDNCLKECIQELSFTLLDVYNTSGKIKLVGKKIIRSKIGRSPDLADSFALTRAVRIYNEENRNIKTKMRLFNNTHDIF
jgi:PBSX family phage terminase large subunit